MKIEKKKEYIRSYIRKQLLKNQIINRAEELENISLSK